MQSSCWFRARHSSITWHPKPAKKVFTCRNGLAQRNWIGAGKPSRCFVATSLCGFGSEAVVSADGGVGKLANTVCPCDPSGQQFWPFPEQGTWKSEFSTSDSAGINRFFRHLSPSEDVPHCGASNSPLSGDRLDGLAGCGGLPDSFPINDDCGPAQAFALLP